MPGGDRTGPAGMGPMTGRGAGFCAGYSVPGYMNPVPGFGRGMGFGRGRGFGRGFRRWGFAPVMPAAVPAAQPMAVPQTQLSAEEEKSMLREELKLIENETKAIKERLAELAKKSKK